jgi:hypothetical protein
MGGQGRSAGALGIGSGQPIEKLVPQPQDDVAFGFSIAK